MSWTSRGRFSGTASPTARYPTPPTRGEGGVAERGEAGEEGFTVEWDEAGSAVWYDILAFSRPQQLLARLGYPFARRLQKRFARDSAAAMRRAVGQDKSTAQVKSDFSP